MTDIIEINRIEALGEHRKAWQALWNETRCATFFQTLEWLEVYWKHFGADKKLRALLAFDRSQLIGIMPLVVTREQTRLGRLAVLTYPLHDWGSFYGPIGRDTTATLTSALAHIARTRRDWELLDIRFVQRDGLDEQRTPGALAAAGFQARESVWNETALLDMTMGWEAYWASRESKVRNNLKRHQKRLLELGQFEHVRFRPPGEAQGDGDPRFDLYDVCVDLALRSWQGQSTTGTTLSHPVVREYLRETHAAAARLGCVDVNLLSIDGTPIGFGYNYIAHGALQGLRVGYDPHYAKAGVGNMLYLYTLQDSFARGDKLFDLGVGTLDIKRFWWTSTAKSYRYTYYPLLAPRAQFLRFKHWLFPKENMDQPGKELFVAG